MVAKTQLTSLIATNQITVHASDMAALEAMHAAIAQYVATHIDGRWSRWRCPIDDAPVFRLSIPAHLLDARYLDGGEVCRTEFCPDFFDWAMSEAGGWDALFAPLHREWRGWAWSWESITLEGHTLTIQAIAQHDRDAAAHEADVRAWDRNCDSP